MTTILVSNGGRVADGGEKGCEDANTTHLVVDENNVELLPPDLSVHSHCQVNKLFINLSSAHISTFKICSFGDINIFQN